MADNRSLDEFAVTGSETEADADADVDAEPDADPGTGPAADATDTDTDTDAAPEGVEPLTGVYDWTPGGAACSACGETVERRWREDGELVCETCKGW